MNTAFKKVPQTKPDNFFQWFLNKKIGGDSLPFFLRDGKMERSKDGKLMTVRLSQSSLAREQGGTADRLKAEN